MLLKNKSLLLLVFSFFSLQSYSQNDILDYIIKDSDTLYGAIRANGTNNKLWFYHRVTRKNGKTFIKEEKLGKTKIRTFRRNGEVYHYQNGEYQTLVPVIPNYIVTTENDTIFGEINKGSLLRKKHLLDKKGVKHQIIPDSVTAYAEDNKVYRYVNGSYSRLILDGPVSLYYYSQAGSNGVVGPGMNFQADLSGVYIKKEEEFQRIYNSGFLLVTREIFGDNQDLMNRINEREFAVENIYLVTQIYNRYLQKKDKTGSSIPKKNL